MQIQKRTIENGEPKGDALLEAIKNLKPDQELITSSVPEAIRIRTSATASPNAIGAAMHALARELKLVRVGYRPAKRPSRHAGAVAVWRAP